MHRAFHFIFPAGAAALGYAAGLSFATSEPRSLGSPGSGESSGASAPAQWERQQNVARVIESVSSPRTLADFARVAEFLDTMRPEDFPALAEQFGKLPRDVYARILVPWYLKWLACDRAAAAAWMKTLLRRSKFDWSFALDWNNGERRLLEAWARALPADAMELIREQWGGHLSVQALGDVINAWPKSDFPGGLQAMLALPDDQHRKDALRNYFGHWVQYDSSAALAAAQTLPPGVDRESAIAQSLVYTGQRDPVGTLERAKSLGQTRGRLLASLITEAAVAKPVDAARWLEQQQNPVWVAAAGPALVSMWARKDPAAAFDWALAHGISITELTPAKWEDDVPGVTWSGLMSGRSSRPLQSAWAQNPDATLAWLRSVPSGPERDSVAAASVKVAQTSASLLAIYGLLSPAQQTEAAPRVMAGLYQRDPAAARNFASQLPAGETREHVWRTAGRFATAPLELPAGPDRDAMFDGLAIRHAADPAQASGYLLQIADPAMRRRAFDHVMWQSLREAPADKAAAARQWLESADVPAEWKQAWRD
jgi:hypothetical protein